MKDIEFTSDRVTSRVRLCPAKLRNGQRSPSLAMLPGPAGVGEQLRRLKEKENDEGVQKLSNDVKWQMLQYAAMSWGQAG